MSIQRGLWRGLRNEGKEILHVVFDYTSDGFEDYFRAIETRVGEVWKKSVVRLTLRLVSRTGGKMFASSALFS